MSLWLWVVFLGRHISKSSPKVDGRRTPDKHLVTGKFAAVTIFAVGKLFDAYEPFKNPTLALFTQGLLGRGWEVIDGLLNCWAFYFGLWTLDFKVIISFSFLVAVTCPTLFFSQKFHGWATLLHSGLVHSWTLLGRFHRESRAHLQGDLPHYLRETLWIPADGQINSLWSHGVQ